MTMKIWKKIKNTIKSRIRIERRRPVHSFSYSYSCS